MDVKAQPEDVILITSDVEIGKVVRLRDNYKRFFIVPNYADFFWVK